MNILLSKKTFSNEKHLNKKWVKTNGKNLYMLNDWRFWKQQLAHKKNICWTHQQKHTYTNSLQNLIGAHF
jgi:hypothetical protein